MSLLQRNLDAAASGALEPVLDYLRTSGGGDYYPRVCLDAGLINVKQRRAILGVFPKRVLSIGISGNFEINGFRVKGERFDSRKIEGLLLETKLETLRGVYLAACGLREY